MYPLTYIDRNGRTVTLWYDSFGRMDDCLGDEPHWPRPSVPELHLKGQYLSSTQRQWTVRHFHFELDPLDRFAPRLRLLAPCCHRWHCQEQERANPVSHSE